MTFKSDVTSEDQLPLGDIKDHWALARAYEEIDYREAEHLSKRDNLASTVVLIVSAISSVSIFSSLVANSPATWAKIVVGVMTAAAAIAALLQKQYGWSTRSSKFSDCAARWNMQAGDARDLAQRVVDGRPVSSERDGSRLDKNEQETMNSQPSVDVRERDLAVDQQRQEFDKRFGIAHPR